MGHLLTENRHGLVVDVELTEAHGRAEREVAVAYVETPSHLVPLSTRECCTHGVLR